MTSQKFYSEILKEFLKEEIGESKRILDIGCGEGTTAIYLASFLNCQINGIDLDKGKIHRAKEKFRKSQKKGVVLCYTCDSRKVNEKFSKNTFDATIIIHAIHHLVDLREVLLKTKYVLKNGGKLFIGEYERDYGEKLDNCPRFSNEKIMSMLKTAGFNDIKNIPIHNNFVMIIAKKGGKI